MLLRPVEGVCRAVVQDVRVGHRLVVQRVVVRLVEVLELGHLRGELPEVLGGLVLHDLVVLSVGHEVHHRHVGQSSRDGERHHGGRQHLQEVRHVEPPDVALHVEGEEEAVHVVEISAALVLDPLRHLVPVDLGELRRDHVVGALAAERVQHGGVHVADVHLDEGAVPPDGAEAVALGVQELDAPRVRQPDEVAHGDGVADDHGERRGEHGGRIELLRDLDVLGVLQPALRVPVVPAQLAHHVEVRPLLVVVEDRVVVPGPAGRPVDPERAVDQDDVVLHVGDEHGRRRRRRVLGVDEREAVAAPAVLVRGLAALLLRDDLDASRHEEGVEDGGSRLGHLDRVPVLADLDPRRGGRQVVLERLLGVLDPGGLLAFRYHAVVRLVETAPGRRRVPLAALALLTVGQLAHRLQIGLAAALRDHAAVLRRLLHLRVDHAVHREGLQVFVVVEDVHHDDLHEDCEGQHPLEGAEPPVADLDILLGAVGQHLVEVHAGDMHHLGGVGGRGRGG
mmetsp:Transcript_110815/g.238550  ORF Transcript_110815/g.238550 Transcript_110815/m.238550 type:complete len:508 (+) Transcript_110815:334-1857(+)